MGWGGSYRGGVGHVRRCGGVGRGGSCWDRVGSCRGGVGHVRVGWVM